ncbi:hypothetical protein Anas_00753 [Armadillidium nasatum]|uniref:DUF659 domain-containing protein n=1 Tax=Armadillidium nasatum TaxID=96803 RepID=A0A5N5THT5_9CRUS|nr:hypothetical protein Anas_00753 [Armadillidium nasatum]
MDLTDVEGDSPTCSMASSMKTWLSDTSKTQRKLSEYTIKTTTAQKEILDQKISKFFYANNVSFLSVESKYFVEMIQALRPGYSPPSRRNLAGPLLDIAHNEVENNLKCQLNEVEGKVCITLCMDGWSSVKNDPIIATSMHTGKQSFLLSTIDSGSDKKNAEYCLKCLKEAVDEVKEKYNSKVFAFCSDNEAKMKLLKEKMKEDDELKTIISYGCSAHYINLLEQEVTPNSILKYIIQIQKFFRNHHQPHGWLKEKGGLMPQIPNDTRWNSQQACINTFIQNYYKYVEIANEDKLEMSITNILSNPSLYREAQHLQKQVDVVSKALDKLQSDTATLSIAVNEWLVLLESEVLDPYKANIRKRMEEATEPFFFVANMMDPQYLG